MSATILPFPPDGEHLAQANPENAGEDAAPDSAKDIAENWGGGREDMGAARGAFAQLARRLHAAGMAEQDAPHYTRAPVRAAPETATPDAHAPGKADSVAAAPTIDETQFWPAGARAFL